MGLLWYFNFVQIPIMPAIPVEPKPGIGKHIAPPAFLRFRWGTMSMPVTGLILAWLNGRLIQALALGAVGGVNGHTAIGIGMGFGIIMWLNVWFIIWPNQAVRIFFDCGSRLLGLRNWPGWRRYRHHSRGTRR